MIRIVVMIAVIFVTWLLPLGASMMIISSLSCIPAVSLNLGSSTIGRIIIIIHTSIRTYVPAYFKLRAIIRLVVILHVACGNAFNMVIIHRGT